MSLIIRAGDFDWNTVWKEMVSQEDDTRTNFSSSIASMDYLHEQIGTMPSFYRNLIRRALDHGIKGIIRDRQISLADMIELLREGDITEKMIRNRVDYLQKTGYLKKSILDDKIFLDATVKTDLNVYSKIPVDYNERMKGYIKTYSKQLYLSPKTTVLALKYADAIANRLGGIGRKPSGLAAALLYAACQERGENVTKNSLRAVSGLSQPSLDSLHRHVMIFL